MGASVLVSTASGAPFLDAPAVGASGLTLSDAIPLLVAPVPEVLDVEAHVQVVRVSGSTSYSVWVPVLVTSAVGAPVSAAPSVWALVLAEFAVMASDDGVYTGWQSVFVSGKDRVGVLLESLTLFVLRTSVGFVVLMG